MSTAKVINLNHKDENRRMSGPELIPEVLKSSKRIAEKRLQGLMDTMFNSMHLTSKTQQSGPIVGPSLWSITQNILWQ